MTFEDVEAFLFTLFIITIVLIIVTAILFGVVHGDFHQYSLTKKRENRRIGDFYEEFCDRMRDL